MILDPNKYQVEKEFDIVVLRQAIRQVAQALELSLVQQARITAAISDIARSFLSHHWSTMFTIHVHQVDLRHALDVLCQQSTHQPHAAHGEFASYIHIESARHLLDEASFGDAAGYVVLTLRLWI